MTNLENLTQSITRPDQEIGEKIDNLRKRKNLLFQQNIMGFYEDSTKHAEKVEAEYKKRGKDARQYKTFHMLINSTVESDNAQPFYDFPEPEYSVEKFIERKEGEKLSK